MSNADWYAQRLAGLRGVAPAPAPAPAQHYPPTAVGLPPHLAPYAAPPQQLQQPYPGQQQPGLPQQGQILSYDANTGAQVADDGTITALVNAAYGMPNGSSMVQKNDAGSCPNCHANTYMVPPTENGAPRRGPDPAPRCTSCNFPSIQAGTGTGGSASTMKSKGPAQRARQLPAGHRVSMVVEGGQVVTFDPPS